MSKSNIGTSRKASAGSIRDRLKIGEEYGIHPLSMLGTAGNSFGTGGMQGGQMIGDAISQAMARKEQRRQEARQDARRWEDHQNNIELLNMRLQSEDARASRAQSEAKLTPEAMRNSVQPWLQPYSDLIQQWSRDGVELTPSASESARRSPLNYKDPNWR